MSPDLAFILTLSLRMAVTAAFVLVAALVTERSGPAIGALVATLPISTGPVYVFLARDHDAAFIAAGALASLPINAATIAFGVIYARLAQNRGLMTSYAGGLVGWFAIAALVQAFQWSLFAGILLNVVTYAIALPLTRHFRDATMPPFVRRWYDMPFRAGLVAVLVGTVMVLSRWVGPTVTGILAVLPVVFSSLILILHPRIGGRATAAVVANGIRGLVGFGIGLVMLQLGAQYVGSATGLLLGLATCVTWNFGLWWFGRRALG
ncbi:MAG TPA: hypothetical protein VHC94_10680 [Nitrobacter sp.]|jgi:hypothetical protein|nr:hypothetical protein [Nitrobacter sp.]